MALAGERGDDHLLLVDAQQIARAAPGHRLVEIARENAVRRAAAANAAVDLERAVVARNDDLGDAVAVDVGVRHRGDCAAAAVVGQLPPLANRVGVHQQLPDETVLGAKHDRLRRGRRGRRGGARLKRHHGRHRAVDVRLIVHVAAEQHAHRAILAPENRVALDAAARRRGRVGAGNGGDGEVIDAVGRHEKVRVLAIVKHVENVLARRPDLEVFDKHAAHVLGERRVEFEKVLALTSGNRTQKTQRHT